MIDDQVLADSKRLVSVLSLERGCDVIMAEWFARRGIWTKEVDLEDNTRQQLCALGLPSMWTDFVIESNIQVVTLSATKGNVALVDLGVRLNLVHIAFESNINNSIFRFPSSKVSLSPCMSKNQEYHTRQQKKSWR